MRHPLTTSGRRRRLQGLAAVANVNGFVVVDAFGLRQAAGDDEFAAAGAAGVLIGTTPSETSNLQPRPPRTLSHVSPRGTRTESVARRFQP
jgi:hypothetical protein